MSGQAKTAPLRFCGCFRFSFTISGGVVRGICLAAICNLTAGSQMFFLWRVPDFLEILVLTIYIILHLLDVDFAAAETLFMSFYGGNTEIRAKHMTEYNRTWTSTMFM